LLKTFSQFTFILFIAFILKFLDTYYQIHTDTLSVEKYGIVSPVGVQIKINGNYFDTVSKGKVCNGNDCDEAWIVIGEVNSGMAHMIRRTLEIMDSNALAPFCFISRGGDIDSSEKIIQLMQQHDATACLGERYYIDEQVFSIGTIDIDGNQVIGTLCMSACAYIYAGANHRVSYGKPLIGVHKIEFGSFYHWRYGTELDSYEESSFQQTLQKLHPSSSKRLTAIKQLSNKVDHNDIRFLTANEIENLELVTEWR